jgi:membrane associated rhomboid family serine protease/Zn-finger nucleic acid-binding protein
MFNCPHCKKLLTRVSGKGANYWQCDNCGGHAIGLALLRRTREPGAINQLWQTTLNPGRPSALKCPSCLAAMKVVPLELDVKAFDVDVCQRCQFFWFDNTELTSIPKKPTPPAEPEKELPQAAREAIALAKVEQIRKDADRTDFSGGDVPDDPWQVLVGFLGLPVEEDCPELRRRPIVTWTLSGIIFIFSVAVLIAGRPALEQFAFIPDQPWRLGGLTLLTSFLTHGSIGHLLSNLYFLITFGDNVEDVIGRKRFIVVLLLSALLGDVLHWMMEPRSSLPSVGASGGISGIIALYALAFPDAKLGRFLRVGYYFRWIQFSAKWGFALWLLLQVITAALQLKGRTHVSALAHLGGAVVGVAYWLVAVRPKRGVNVA